MTYKVCYWDSDAGEQRERNATPEEVSEIEERKVAVNIPAVPQSVTMRQARQKLAAITVDGMTGIEKTNAIIASMSEPEKTQAQIEWEYSTVVERDRPLVALMMAEFPLTEVETDQLFIEASQL